MRDCTEQSAADGPAKRRVRSAGGRMHFGEQDTPFEHLDDLAPAADDADILRLIREFDSFGRETEQIERRGINYLVNEYWTSGQRKSHSLHEISYRACFKAQLPEFFISRLTQPGDAVLDPFMGRGTTPLQAALMGRRAFGSDINPLSALLLEPRLKRVDLTGIRAAIAELPIGHEEIRDHELLAFYSPRTLGQLCALRTFFNETLSGSDYIGKLELAWLRMVCLNRLSGHSPGFFSGRSMPPNQAVSLRAQRKINERLGASPPDRDIASILLKKTRSLLRDGAIPLEVESRVFCSAADRQPQIRDASIRLIVTSPPFLDIVQYAADNWLRCWFAGIDAEEVEISTHRTAQDWTEMVHGAFSEMARILKPGGHVAFEVGEVRNSKVFLEELAWQAADGLPFDRLGVMVNDQEFTKTANCWGVLNGKRGTNSNRIVLLRRH